MIITLATSQNSENGKQNTKWLHETTWCCCDEKLVHDHAVPSTIESKIRQNFWQLMVIRRGIWVDVCTFAFCCFLTSYEHGEILF
jgi:hypothetical protein